MEEWILKLLKNKQVIYTVNELAKYIKHSSENYLRVRISYYCKNGIFKRLARWIYATRDKYDIFELANKIYSPSYISFYSALYHHKMIFQYPHDVYLAYQKSDSKELDGFKIILKNLKKDLLFNSEGIEVTEQYSIASKERAFLDTLYIYSETFFDNLDWLDWWKVKELVKIYKSKKLEKLLKTYIF